MTSLAIATKTYLKRLLLVALLPLFVIVFVYKLYNSAWPLVLMFIPAMQYAALPIFARKAPESFWAVILGCFTGGTVVGAIVLFLL